MAAVTSPMAVTSSSVAMVMPHACLMENNPQPDAKRQKKTVKDDEIKVDNN